MFFVELGASMMLASMIVPVLSRRPSVAKNTELIALLLGFANLLIAGRYATG